MSSLAPIAAAMQTDQGQVRDHNEDFIARWEPVSAEEEAEHGWLYIVADGVGGADAGEVASQFATERTLAQYLAHNETKNLGERLVNAMHGANTDLRHLVVERNDNKRMATTMVAVGIRDGIAYYGNVGDSRGYLWRQGELQQVTKDQSLVAKLVEEGAITEEEAAIHPHRNVILYSIGSEKSPQIDLFEVQLELGDKLFLCSDGLTRHVSDSEICELIGSEDLETAVPILVDLANQRGGQDNITVALINFGEFVAPEESVIDSIPEMTAVAAAENLASSNGASAKFLWPFTIFLAFIQTILIIMVWLLFLRL
ncbi:MAG: Stp1/IreP family PP2C-type Ser/Thr phosphatase [Anaerolineales bacterium]|nr:Stp1/IreP family PP2C-type Ser/Thr phosphatase [Anaerolineales bacterium]